MGAGRVVEGDEASEPERVSRAFGGGGGERAAALVVSAAPSPCVIGALARERGNPLPALLSRPRRRRRRAPSEPLVGPSNGEEAGEQPGRAALFSRRLQ